MKIEAYSPTIRRREMDAVLTCLVSEKIGPGEMNTKFGQLLKEKQPLDFSVALRSPSYALALSLKALGVEKGSKIIVSALAPFWHYSGVVAAGYEPLVVDVSSDTGFPTALVLENAVKEGGRAVVLHEPLGLLPEFREYESLGIPVIEDISQSFGAVSGEQKAGTFGSYCILGLEEKDLLTCAGGAVLIAGSRREGVVLKHLLEDVPSEELLPDVHSALGFVQLKELERNSQVSKEIHDLYIKSFFRNAGKHKMLLTAENVVPAVYSFPVVLSGGVKEVRAYAHKKEVETAFAFENSVYSKRQEEMENYINAKSLFLRTLLFPLYPRLGKTNVSKVIKVLATLP